MGKWKLGKLLSTVGGANDYISVEEHTSWIIDHKESSARIPGNNSGENRYFSKV